MPMGIVSDKDFDSELSNCSERVKREESKSPVSQDETIPSAIDSISAEIIDINRGRGEGSLEVPNSLRNLIGETSVLEGRGPALDLAKQFGISPSSVSAYDNGSTSTASYNRQPNLDKLNAARLRIQRKARRTLISALDTITPEKLADAKVKDVSGVARDMAAIIKDMEPEQSKSDTKGQNAPQFIFYSPQFVKEESFDVIYSRE